MSIQLRRLQHNGSQNRHFSALTVHCIAELKATEEITSYGSCTRWQHLHTKTVFIKLFFVIFFEVASILYICLRETVDREKLYNTEIM